MVQSTQPDYSSLARKVAAQQAQIDALGVQVKNLRAVAQAPQGYMRAFATKGNFNREADNVAVFYYTPTH